MIATGFLIALQLVILGLVIWQMTHPPEAPKAKIGRPRGSRNRPAQTLVEQAQNYFGPRVEPKKEVSPEELADLIRYVNEGRIAGEEQMVDPNDEFRTSTGYAGT